MQSHSLIRCKIFLEVQCDCTQLLNQFRWLQHGAVFTVAEQDATRIKQVGEPCGHCRGTVRMGLYLLAGEMLADAITGDDRAESIFQDIGNRGWSSRRN